MFIHHNPINIHTFKVLLVVACKPNKLQNLHRLILVNWKSLIRKKCAAKEPEFQPPPHPRVVGFPNPIFHRKIK
jgi:hypothetical protein